MATFYKRQAGGITPPPRSQGLPELASSLGEVGIRAGLELERRKVADEVIDRGLATGDFSLPETARWDFIGQRAGEMAMEDIRKASSVYYDNQMQRFSTVTALNKEMSPDDRVGAMGAYREMSDKMIEGVDDSRQQALLRMTQGTHIAQMSAKDNIFSLGEARVAKTREWDNGVVEALVGIDTQGENGDVDGLLERRARLENIYGQRDDPTSTQTSNHISAMAKVDEQVRIAIGSRADDSVMAGTHRHEVWKQVAGDLQRYSGLNRATAREEAHDVVNGAIRDDILRGLSTNAPVIVGNEGPEELKRKQELIGERVQLALERADKELTGESATLAVITINSRGDSMGNPKSEVGLHERTVALVGDFHTFAAEVSFANPDRKKILNARVVALAEQARSDLADGTIDDETFREIGAELATALTEAQKIGVEKPKKRGVDEENKGNLTGAALAEHNSDQPRETVIQSGREAYTGYVNGYQDYVRGDADQELFTYHADNLAGQAAHIYNYFPGGKYKINVDGTSITVTHGKLPTPFLEHHYGFAPAQGGGGRVIDRMRIEDGHHKVGPEGVVWRALFDAPDGIFKDVPITPVFRQDGVFFQIDAAPDQMRSPAMRKFLVDAATIGARDGDADEQIDLLTPSVRLSLGEVMRANPDLVPLLDADVSDRIFYMRTGILPSEEMKKPSITRRVEEMEVGYAGRMIAPVRHAWANHILAGGGEADTARTSSVEFFEEVDIKLKATGHFTEEQIAQMSPGKKRIYDRWLSLENAQWVTPQGGFTTLDRLIAHHGAEIIDNETGEPISDEEASDFVNNLDDQLKHTGNPLLLFEKLIYAEDADGYVIGTANMKYSVRVPYGQGKEPTPANPTGEIPGQKNPLAAQQRLLKIFQQ